MIVNDDAFNRLKYIEVVWGQVVWGQTLPF